MSRSYRRSGSDDDYFEAQRIARENDKRAKKKQKQHSHTNYEDEDETPTLTTATKRKW